MYTVSFSRRLVLAVFLAFVSSAGWLFYAATAIPSSVAANTASARLHQVRHGTGSASAVLSLTPTASQKLFSYNATLYQLTSGLRPGRGDAIPDARDVHEMPVVDISFYNWRGNLLSGWFALNTPQAPVIILNHGTPGNRVSMIGRAAFLYNHGYNVLLFDFQSYGHSQGTMSTLGMVESEDILAAVSYIHSLPATLNSKVGVLGLSMGATAAVLAASRTTDIEAVVAESCPVDATRVPGDVPSETARQADRELVEQVYGVDITKARPIDVVNKLAGHTALFFINGDVDTITPLPGMQSLYQAAGEPKQDWVVPTAGHAQSFAVDMGGFISRVDDFFDTYLSH